MAALGLAMPVMRTNTRSSGGGQQYQQNNQQQQQLQMQMPPMQQQQQQQQQPQMIQQMNQAAVPQPLDASHITIKLATLAGERFKELFYTVFDAHRTDLARFFTAHSTLVWEGMVVGGQQYCAKLFEMLPPSKHTIATFDVHPVTGGAEMRGAVNTLLVNVTGTVHWGMAGSEMAATAQGFYHSFVLERSQSSSGGKSVHHIISASIRTRQVDEQQTYAGGDSAPRPRKRMSYQNR